VSSLAKTGRVEGWRSVAGVCADLLLSYQRNSVGIVGGGNGGDKGGRGRFCGKEGRMGGSIVWSDGLEVVEIELIEVNKQFRQIAVQILIDLLE